MTIFSNTFQATLPIRFQVIIDGYVSIYGADDLTANNLAAKAHHFDRNCHEPVPHITLIQ